MERYYLDTSIWLDFFEKRGKNSEIARKLIEKIIDNNILIIFSNLNILELRNLGYSFDEISNMISILKDRIRRAYISNEEKELAKKIALKKNIPEGDVLHAVLARNNEAILISNDLHFVKIKDIIEVRNPEEII